MAHFDLTKLTKLQAFKKLECKTQLRKWRDEPIISWQTWQKRAEATAKIKFGCDFDHSGLCRRYREDNERYGRKPKVEDQEMCCCSGCRNAFGYLNAIPPGTARTISRLFSLATGFWRKGKGCILPRKYRSATCLAYNCFAEVKVGRFLETGQLVQIEREPNYVHYGTGGRF